MDLLPPALVVARYFATERAEVDRLRAEEDTIARELDAFVEEYTGEDGLLDGATTDSGKVTQVAVRARLKEVADDPEGREERDALDVLPRSDDGACRGEEGGEGCADEAGCKGARALRDADRRGDRRARG